MNEPSCNLRPAQALPRLPPVRGASNLRTPWLRLLVTYIVYNSFNAYSKRAALRRTGVKSRFDCFRCFERRRGFEMLRADLTPVRVPKKCRVKIQFLMAEPQGD